MSIFWNVQRDCSLHKVLGVSKTSSLSMIESKWIIVQKGENVK